MTNRNPRRLSVLHEESGEESDGGNFADAAQGGKSRLADPTSRARRRSRKRMAAASEDDLEEGCDEESDVFVGIHRQSNSLDSAPSQTQSPHRLARNVSEPASLSAYSSPARLAQMEALSTSRPLVMTPSTSLSSGGAADGQGVGAVASSVPVAPASPASSCSALTSTVTLVPLTVSGKHH